MYHLVVLNIIIFIIIIIIVVVVVLAVISITTIIIAIIIFTIIIMTSWFQCLEEGSPCMNSYQCCRDVRGAHMKCMVESSEQGGSFGLGLCRPAEQFELGLPAMRFGFKKEGLFNIISYITIYIKIRYI